MDQDSFRELLQGSGTRPSASSTLGVGSGSRAKLAVPQKQKVVEPAKPAFKPRKVTKQQDSKYRDRAAERRVGKDNDYAHVEAVLEDFEKKHADEDKEKVDAQRKYLGGDSDHTVLVKGLDFALLQQQKSKTGQLSKDDLDDLDRAFHEGSSHVTTDIAPTKKRTRGELIQELKQKRGGGKSASVPEESESQSLEDAKQKGKFKPIGFKSIGASSKKRKETGEGEKKKKKKRKVEESSVDDTSKAGSSQLDATAPQTSVQPLESTPSAPEPISEPVDADFDIFADVGEYTGFEIDEDEDDEDANNNTKTKPTTNPSEEIEEGEELSAIPRRWFDDDEPRESALPTKPAVKLSRQLEPSTEATTHSADDDIAMEEDQPTRLTGLESSKVPSIKDLLAMDEAAAKYEQKQKRKDKKKKKVKGDDDDD
ncbi:RED-like protein N-terminal region-domain-containing protein [Crepidotus variabilis]|uniref:RED-like protein N-terminal region-domain-containing protein n=1 Tax=Crepidotus variabilis TaxID=179855 RepID=A0A9P6EIT2_9AGAR|nr:RED-like protein N-terminal region-domain-containing protein [Crepidotus variabilis]